jgi:hypothetical protein
VRFVRRRAPRGPGGGSVGCALGEKRDQAPQEVETSQILTSNRT